MIGAPDHGAAAGPPGTTFAVGELVADRFHIVRFIARGGMGEVYEAEDRELREHVALKTIRPEIAAAERALERFRREVRVARQVTHPNVCRIYDVFRHDTRTAPGSRDVVFVTMEVLRGETLAERLRRNGRFPPDEALPLVRQMAMALAAAHDAGVVHRDFKSSNVMLLPPRSDRATTRVVVTDFGLARRSANEDASVTSVSAAGLVWGTPAYMAPEQIEGREITGAVDIYALGVVMFDALRMYDEALATYRQIGDRSGVATVLNNIANIARQQADMAGALKR